MRWFTRVRNDNPDFDDWEAVRTAYWTYIDSIRDELPPDLRRLTRIDLHDAVFDMADVDLLRRTAHLRLLAGDRATFIDCQYEDADFGDSKLQYLGLAIEARVPQRDRSGKVLGWGPLGSVLHDEITLVGQRFQHEFLIEPFGDFAVSFRAFALSTTPAQEAGLPEREERFRVVNQWSDSHERAAPN
jgi:hypothetical protein